jgi:hypothetical protein
VTSASADCGWDRVAARRERRPCDAPPSPAPQPPAHATLRGRRDGRPGLVLEQVQGGQGVGRQLVMGRKRPLSVHYAQQHRLELLRVCRIGKWRPGRPAIPARAGCPGPRMRPDARPGLHPTRSSVRRRGSRRFAPGWHHARPCRMGGDRSRQRRPGVFGAMPGIP